MRAQLKKKNQQKETKDLRNNWWRNSNGSNTNINNEKILNIMIITIVSRRYTPSTA